jgi:hypothetical protein
MADLATRIVDGSIPEPNSGCWLWLGAVYRSRRLHEYGFFSVKNRRTSVHRASYLTFKGPIPNGMVCRHTCDNSLCVNPEHLIVGTQADNVRDMWARRRAHHQINPGINVGAATRANETMRAQPHLRASGDRHGMWRRPQNGTANGAAKITDEIAAEIRALGASRQLSQRAIARKFGLTQGVVWRIIHRKAWRAAALKARSLELSGQREAGGGEKVGGGGDN